MWRLPPLANALLAVLAGLALWVNIRLAVAHTLFRTGDAASLQQAMRLAPAEPRFHLRYAHMTEGPQADESFQSALRVAPGLAGAWLAYAGWLESQGRTGEAEEKYLRAARLSQTARPRFALANFYYRAGQPDRFLAWARQTAAVPGASLDGVFALVARSAMEPTGLWEEILPDRAEAWRQCVDFHLRRQDWKPVRRVALRLAGAGHREDAERLMWYVDFEILFGEPAYGLAVWNLLTRSGLAPGPEISPASGPWLANPSFASNPVHRGFDWRFQEGSGFWLNASGNPRHLRLELSGAQSPGADFAQQFLYLAAGRRYRFSYEARTEGFVADSGLAWLILNGRTPARIGESRFQGDAWKKYSVEFRCPADQPLVRLVLRYQRPPGRPRVQGSAEFRRLSLNLAGEPKT